ncbi:hypothetical protein ABMY26_07515 [Azospirillum sp. HJ39]|uniref:hypothetical protein n=1 Tax=Azospirillum sp. HJ39 TaxID=3159496 RepID=UPI003558DE50
MNVNSAVLYLCPLPTSEFVQNMLVFRRWQGACILGHVPQGSEASLGKASPQPMATVIPQLQQPTVQHPLNDRSRLRLVPCAPSMDDSQCEHSIITVAQFSPAEALNHTG